MFTSVKMWYAGDVQYVGARRSARHSKSASRRSGGRATHRRRNSAYGGGVRDGGASSPWMSRAARRLRRRRRLVLEASLVGLAFVGVPVVASPPVRASVQPAELRASCRVGAGGVHHLVVSFVDGSISVVPNDSSLSSDLRRSCCHGRIVGGHAEAELEPAGSRRVRAVTSIAAGDVRAARVRRRRRGRREWRPAAAKAGVAAQAVAAPSEPRGLAAADAEVRFGRVLRRPGSNERPGIGRPSAAASSAAGVRAASSTGGGLGQLIVAVARRSEVERRRAVGQSTELEAIALAS